jgi:uncharacterized protein
MLADHIGIPHLRELASKEESLKTAISAFDMPRLAELLHSDAEADNQRLMLDIRFQRSSGVDPGYPEISGSLDVVLDLTCQRCLGLLPWVDQVSLKLVVVESDAAADQLAEPYDSVLVDGQGICLLEVAEDELLSSLPLAPMHANASECEHDGKDDVTNIILSDDDEETNMPFSDLADLLKGSSDENTD